MIWQNRSWHIDRAIVFAITIIVLGSLLLAFMPEPVVLLIAVLLVGLPLATLVVSNKTRHHAVILMLVALPLTSILKAATGSRFAPLTFDLGLLFSCVLLLLSNMARPKLRLGRLDLLLFLLWVLALAQIFNPNLPSLQAGIEGFRKFAYISLTFFLGRHMFKMRELRLFARLTLLVSFPVALYGLKQFVVMWPIDYRMIELATASEVTYTMGGWIRPFSTMPGPFQLGIYLMVTMLLLWAMLSKLGRQRYPRMILFALFLLQGAVMVMTRTKGNWVGLLVGITILIVLQSRHPLRLVGRLFLLGIVTGTVLLVLTSVTDGVIPDVIDDALFAITHPLEAPTFIYRLDLWENNMIPALQQHPLIGYGTGSAGEGLRNLFEGTDSQYFFSHNLFLKIWLELGLLGLLLFLWLVGESVWIGLRYSRKMVAGREELATLLQWAIAVIGSFLISGAVIATLDAYPPNYYFWLLLGILSRAAEIDEPL